MELDSQYELEHLLLVNRTCRVCGEEKSLLDDFYLTRKGRGPFPSAYAYECKLCTIKRITKYRKKPKKILEEIYPDW